MSREFAPPVSSPPFFYYPTSGLYVEIDHNRHSRSNSDRLHHLLTYKDPGPALTKAGKPKVHQPAPHKDEPGHFYVAQLLLYGLKPLKSKPAAKKALLTALQGDGGLTVPENIRKVERDLAAEYDVKNAAAEKERQKQKLLEKERREKERKKRQRDEDDLLAEIQAPSYKKSKSNKVRGPLLLIVHLATISIVFTLLTFPSGPKAPRNRRHIRRLPNRRTGRLQRLGLSRSPNAQVRPLGDHKAPLGLL